MSLFPVKDASRKRSGGTGVKISFRFRISQNQNSTYANDLLNGEKRGARFAPLSSIEM
jgi:hypothetical protein